MFGDVCDPELIRAGPVEVVLDEVGGDAVGADAFPLAPPRDAS